MNNHGNYNSRYDILIGTGDYDENSMIGPGVQFSDVNAHDCGVDKVYLDQYLKIGYNVHIIAEVGEYNSNTGIFHLIPISVVVR